MARHATPEKGRLRKPTTVLDGRDGLRGRVGRGRAGRGGPAGRDDPQRLRATAPLAGDRRRLLHRRSFARDLRPQALGRLGDADELGRPARARRLGGGGQQIATGLEGKPVGPPVPKGSRGRAVPKASRGPLVPKRSRGLPVPKASPDHRGSPARPAKEVRGAIRSCTAASRPKRRSGKKTTSTSTRPRHSFTGRRRAACGVPPLRSPARKSK